MRKIGIIGGMGPETTLEYYEKLIELSREHLGEYVYPEIVIYSVNFSEMILLMERGRWEELGRKIISIFSSLKNMGCEVLALATNTVHIALEHFQKPEGLVHMIEEVSKYSKRMGLKKVLLLGTKYTMSSDLYPRYFEKEGMKVLRPDDEDMEVVNGIIFEKLVNGVLAEEDKRKLEVIMKKGIERGAEGIILGCTELTLFKYDVPVPLLDTVDIHVDALFKRSIT